ncbi:MAG: GAF domain-containing protein [Anaerolineae bacterium]
MAEQPNTPEQEPRPADDQAAPPPARARRQAPDAASAADLARINEQLQDEIARRQRIGEELRRANRMLTVLSECNQAVVRATEEPALLHEVCRIVVDLGGYPLAWVGFAEQDAARTVRPVAQAGAEPGFLEAAAMTWADTERGRSPAGRAIRSGRPALAADLRTDPDFAPWREDALRRGYAAALALPVQRGDQMFGALSIYAALPDAFGPQEVRLLAELSADLAYGITALRDRDLRRRTAAALRESEQRYRGLVEMSPDAVAVHDGRHLLFVNSACARMMGVAHPEEATGRPVADFVHPDSRPVMATRVRQMLQEGKPAPLIEEKFQRADGSPIDVEVAAMPITWQGKPAIQATFRQITERKRAERVQAALYRLSEAAQSAPSLEELYHAIHAIIGRLMPARNFYIALYQAATETLHFPYYADERDTTPPPQKLGRGLTDLVLRSGKSLLATPERYAQLVASGQVKVLGSPAVDWLGVPLKTRQGETVGVMAVQTYSEEVRLAVTDQHILEFVSTQVTMAIERKRTDESRA